MWANSLDSNGSDQTQKCWLRSKTDWFLDEKLIFRVLLPHTVLFIYQNMNGTVLSQIAWFMFLAHHCLTKIAKNCQKSQKFISCKLLHSLKQFGIRWHRHSKNNFNTMSMARFYTRSNYSASKTSHKIVAFYPFNWIKLTSLTGSVFIQALMPETSIVILRVCRVKCIYI